MSLICKKDGYYFRGFVPKKLFDIIYQKTIDKKLCTHNRKVALRRVKNLQIIFKYLIEELILAKKNKKIYDFIDKYLIEYFRAKEQYLYSLSATEIEKLVQNGYFADEVMRYQVDKYYQHDYVVHIIKSLLKYHDEDNIVNINSFDIEDTNDDITHYFINKLEQVAEVIAVQAQQGLYDGTNPNEANPFKETINITSDINQNVTLGVTQNLQQYIDEYIEETSITMNWAEYTISQHKTALSVLTYEFGNIDIKSITRKSLYSLIQKIKILPTRWRDRHGFEVLKDIDSILEANKTANVPVLSVRTTKGYLQAIKGLFAWCTDNDYIDKDITTTLSIASTKYDKDKSDKMHYEMEDLEELFSSPFYTTHLVKNIQENIHKVFIPIIALYTGMRLNEIASLYVIDIMEKEGIYYFNIQWNKDKSVKNKSSNRIVPIHDEIIKAGFLKHIKKLKQNNHERVWMKLNKKLKFDKNSTQNSLHRDEGNYGTAISSWFNKYSKQHITNNDKKSFHSIRHNTTDAFINGGVNESIKNELMGWSKGNIGDDRYASGRSIVELKQNIDKIKYDVKSLDKVIKTINANI